MAPKNSRIPGRLISIPETKSIITEKVKLETYAMLKKRITKIISEKNIELLHFHGVDFFNYLPDTETPFLATFHLPMELYPLKELTKRKNANFNFVSQRQRESAPVALQKYPVVRNGIDMNQIRFTRQTKSDYLLCIGRICPEKGFDIGLKIAKKLGISLLIAGKVFPYESHIQYFKQKIFPELDNSTYRFLGIAGKRKKVKLIANALCVLITSQIDETSSLVAMEALSCGTPVVAFNRGALSDIVEHGVTGYICNSEEEMEEAILNIHKIDRTKCMEIAKLQFSGECMARSYVELYKAIIRD
jgi:glycosyltransferase involved in cell wall biosynthesis